MTDKIDGSQLRDSNVNLTAEDAALKSLKLKVGDEGMEPDVAKRRKFLMASVAATPVLMTLVSRPVHAVQGLSNMMSVAASDCRGDNRYGGFSHEKWKNLNGGALFGDRIVDAWNKMQPPLVYAETMQDGSPITVSDYVKNFDEFAGGTLYKDVFSIPGYGNLTLREVLSESGDGKFYVQAILNIRYLEAIGEKYIFTEHKFGQMLVDPGEIPYPYDSVAEFIEAVQDLEPGSGCLNL